MSCEDIPSLLDLQKVKKHADDFGRLMGTGTGTSTNKVTGQVRPTFNKVINDMRGEFNQHIAGMGFTRFGTFAAGATLTNPRQTLLWDIADGGDGQEYGWSGTFLPSGKVVPPNSTPASTGGIAVGAWISRFDPTLRTQVFEALRRSYAEVGHDLIGMFSSTGMVVNVVTDVVLWEPTGVAYAYSGMLPHPISAGESPVGDPLWVQMDDKLLRQESLDNDRHIWAALLETESVTQVAGSFEEGATVTDYNQVVWSQQLGYCYRYIGTITALGVTVPANSAPDANWSIVTSNNTVCTVTPESYGADGTAANDTRALKACFKKAYDTPTEIVLSRIYQVNEALTCYYVQTHNKAFTLRGKHQNCGINWVGTTQKTFVVDVHGYSSVIKDLRMVKGSGGVSVNTAIRVCGENNIVDNITCRGAWSKHVLGVVALKSKYSRIDIQTYGGVITDFVGAGVQLYACVNSTVSHCMAVGTYVPYAAGLIPGVDLIPGDLVPPSLTGPITWGVEGVDFVSCKSVKSKIGALLHGLEIVMDNCVLDFCVEKYWSVSGQMIKITNSWFACDSTTASGQEMMKFFSPGVAYLICDSNTFDVSQSSDDNQVANFTAVYSNFTNNILNGIAVTVDGTSEMVVYGNIPALGAPDVVMKPVGFVSSITPRRTKERKAQGVILGNDASDGDGKLQIRANSGERMFNCMTAVGTILSTTQGGHEVKVTTPNNNAVLFVGSMTATSRSINATGTVNASGSDYAEYMRKAAGCGVIAKGQIVGITADAELTDVFDNAIAFAIKSTDPSMVGGDTWSNGLVYPEFTGGDKPSEPLMPVRRHGQSDDDFQRVTSSTEQVYQACLAEYNNARAEHEAEVAAYEAALEAIRVKYDRVAFSGQVPCNVYGASAGDFIVPVRNGDGSIGAVSEAKPTFEQYLAAVGTVWSVMDDGRSWVAVKIS